MKKLFLFSSIGLLFNCTLLFSEAYVVVNPNGSIHCIEEKPSEVLKNGKKRFIIEEYLSVDNDLYYWGTGGLTLRPQSEQDIIVSKRVENKRKIALREAVKKKNEIVELESMDSGDWSEEKAKWQSVIDANLKGK